MGRAGAARVDQQHDSEKEVAKLVALFRQSIAQTKPGKVARELEPAGTL
jgi:hypothetical protein